MPTYDYRCTKCGYQFELFQAMSAEPLQICPQCNGELKRLIGTGAGPIFKGTGFYQTDYKNKTANSNSKISGTEKKSSESLKKASDSEK
jgi:putative FmdB family regulatory protein